MTDAGSATDMPRANSDGVGGGRCDYPDCIKMYMDQCKPMGTCTEQSPQTGQSNKCYANGVKEFTTATSLTPTMGRVRLTKPDGTTCLTTEVTEGSSGGQSTFTFVFRHATGMVIATGMFNEQTKQGSITCSNGVSKVIPPDCDETDPPCSPGMCM